MTDILNTVSQYVDLKKVGANWKGRCPFHDIQHDAQPFPESLWVHPESDRYYCFTCGATGGAADFEAEMNPQTFDTVEATGGFCAPVSTAYEILHRRLISENPIELALLWQQDVDVLRAKYLDTPLSKEKKRARIQREIFARETAIMMLQVGPVERVVTHLEATRDLLNEHLELGEKGAVRKLRQAHLSAVQSLLVDLAVLQAGGGYIDPESPVAASLPTVEAPRGGIGYAASLQGDVERLTAAYVEWGESTIDDQAAHRRLGEAVRLFLGLA